MKTTPKGYTMSTMGGGTREFYCRMGRFFANRQIVKELEGPMFDDKSYMWVIASHGDEIAGFSSCYFEDDIARFGVTYVMPDHRRNGLYRHMFALKLAICTDRGAPEIRGLANPIASRMFIENGFAEVRKAGKWTHYTLALKEIV